MLTYGKLYGIPTICTRFFNVYGPNQNPSSPYSGVLSLIAETIENEGTFTVFGDGCQTRDFVYVEDVTNSLEILAKNQNLKSVVINVATGRETSLNQIITIFERISGQSLEIRFQEGRAGDIKKSVADVSELDKIYSVQFNLNKGLRKYWNYLTINKFS